MTATAQSAFSFAPLDDVCKRKHGGNKHSVQANTATAPAKESRREMILKHITQKAHYGVTREELSIQLKMRYTTVSGRCSDLLRDNLIFESSRERKTTTGCSSGVLVSDPKFVQGMN